MHNGSLEKIYIYIYPWTILERSDITKKYLNYHRQILVRYPWINPWYIPEIYMRYIHIWDIFKIFQLYPWDFLDISLRHPRYIFDKTLRDSTERSLRDPWVILERSMRDFRYLWDISRISLRYPRYISERFLRHVWEISEYFWEILKRSLRDPWDIYEIHLRDLWEIPEYHTHTHTRMHVRAHTHTHTHRLTE